MRIGRFRADGETRIGRFENGAVVDVSPSFESFADALTRQDDIADVEGRQFDLAAVERLPPTTERNSVFCAALNYEAHAEESQSTVPNHPFIFLKLPRTLVGADEPIAYHTRVTGEIDYEAELAAVIGTPARHVNPDDALSYVAGYTILNDISARDLQMSFDHKGSIDWFSGKAIQNTTPVGPYVVTDEIDDPQSLDIVSRVNGEVMQDDNTEMMVRSVSDLVSFLSSRVRLKPGDIIATGTPEGVGTFQDIQLYPGDTVEIELEGVGTLKNRVVERS